MKYTTVFPDAHPFEEVLLSKQLFKVLESSKCLWCQELTDFLTYEFNWKPVAVCGPDCLAYMEALKRAAKK